MLNRNLIIGLVVVALVLLGGWFYIQSQSTTKLQTTQEEVTPAQTPQPSPTPQADQERVENTVSIKSSGFSPKEIKIKAGEKVTWVNDDSEEHQVNSATHPSHTAYPPLNTVGFLKPGAKKSLEFPAKGTYKYHDHLNPSLTGTVVVE